MYNLYALSILAIIPFPLTYIISYPLALAYLIPLLFQFYKTIKGKPVLLNDKIVEIISFFCLLFFIIDVLFISRRLIIVAIHLTMGLVLIKTFNLKTKRDKYLFLLLLFFLISAGIANSFHIILFPYLLICLYYFLKFLMEENNVDSKKSILFSSITVFSGILISVPLFISFPRVKTPYIPGIGFKGESFAYGENILNLNDIESLKLTNEIVMRIELNKKIEKQSEIYIRLKTFSLYNGGVWSQPKPDYKLIRSEKFGYFKFSNQKDNLSAEIFSRIYFQNLPSLYGTTSLQIPLEFINVSRDGSFLLPTGLQRRRLKFKIDAVEKMELYNAKEPSREEKRKLENRELKELARGIFGEEEDNNKKIDKLLSFFYKNYNYGLESSNLEDFLFKSKRGHCELFATGCALLLREGGIPSRIVVGYLGGEKHPWQNYLIIRSSNSHAWVEAFVDGKWVLLDPTPPSFRPSISEGNIKAFFKYLFESISFFWDRNILGFTYTEQTQILNFLKENITVILRVLYFLFLLIFAILIVFIIKNLKIKRTLFYLRYYKILKKRAIKKLKLEEGITPQRLSFILKNLNPESEHYIDNFFKLYLDSSFGGKKISKKEMKYYFKKIII